MSTRPHMRRLFFALWPSDALRARLEESVQPMLTGRSARKIAAANFHVTLMFLGAVNEDLLPQIRLAAESIECDAFTVSFDRIELWKRAQLVCLTAAVVPNELVSLVGHLRASLASLRIEADHLEFKPHVTLAREWRDLRVNEAFGPLQWPADEFVLVESQTGSAGSNYVVLERWPLVKVNE